MKTVRVTIDVSDPATKPVGRIDARRVDATTEEDLTRQQAQDDAEARADAGRRVEGLLISDAR